MWDLILRSYNNIKNYIVLGMRMVPQIGIEFNSQLREVFENYYALKGYQLELDSNTKVLIVKYDYNLTDDKCICVYDLYILK